MRTFIILAALLSIALAYSDAEYQQSFTNWMIKFQKSYSSEEFQTRFSIFRNNMDYIRDWNAQGSSTVLGLGPFADITNAEYRKIYLGTHFDGTARLAAASASRSTLKVAANATVDWVAKGAVTAIKDQGQCGSCWSFSTTGSVEGAHFLSTMNLVSLSEQNLMDCSTKEGNNGCNGGLMDYAFEYIIKNNGIDTEASYPYLAKDEAKCNYKAANSGATIASYTDVTSGDETALATAANKQPISVAIDAALDSFQHYSTGIYYEPKCSSTALDHGVLVVGYGTEADGDYWLVKNSWGTSWGENGYIQMARNQNNNCGIATMASFPTV